MYKINIYALFYYVIVNYLHKYKIRINICTYITFIMFLFILVPERRYVIYVLVL